LGRLDLRDLVSISDGLPRVNTYLGEFIPTKRKKKIQFGN
jgi:hypothetical protein